MKAKITLKQSSQDIVSVYVNGEFVGRTLGSTDKSHRFYKTPKEALLDVYASRDSDKYDR